MVMLPPEILAPEKNDTGFSADCRLVASHSLSM